MTFVSCHRPFYRTALLAASALAALVLLTPALIEPARAQATQQAALSGGANSESVKPAAPTTDKTEAGNVAAVDQADPQSQRRSKR
jgi:hypothetical protein